VLAALVAGSAFALADGPDPADAGPGIAAEMESSLVDLARAEPERRREVAADGGLELKRDRVQVEVIEASGGIRETRVPVAELPDLAADPSVRFVQAPLPLLPEAVTGEGVGPSGAETAHTQGFTGAGVRIVILDVGFAGYALSAVTGEVPSGPPVLDLCTNINSSTHGTQVAEVIHEMAPGAQISLACTDTAGDTGPAVDWAQAQGAQIISRSLGEAAVMRGDGSGGPGTTDAAAEDALSTGILWVNSAGNYARSHWSGNFTDGDTDLSLNYAGSDERNSFVIGAGQTQCVRIKWDDWPATAINYNAYLHRSSDDSIVDTALTVQTGTQPPREVMCYTNPGATQSFGVEIRKLAAPLGADPRIDIFATDAFELEHRVAASSVSESVGAPEVFSVAAVCRTTSAIQPYSSQGPVIDGRTSPDIGAHTSVSNSFAPSSGCSGGFSGTSAAAPHVAGAAALYKQALGLDPPGLRAALEGDAVGLGAEGKDDVFGSGLLRVRLGTCAGRRATVLGSNGPDVLRGTPGADVILGLGGRDTLSGLKGPDRLCGGAGRDALLGGQGADRLLGQAGRDRLLGGPGKDRLKGGPGRDIQKQGR
jgi:subtilisin family serine protease